MRAWLHPHSSTSSPHSLVGRPWEIFRSQTLTPHTTDIHGKNGGAYGYTAQLSVIDSYGIGVVVLTAGPPDAWVKLYDAMLATFVAAVEAESRMQAGMYKGAWSGREETLSLGLSIDHGPGLKLDHLTRKGSDMLTALSHIYAQALPQFGDLSTDSRIFPTDIETCDT